MFSTVSRLSVGVLAMVIAAGCGLGPDPKLGLYVSIPDPPISDFNIEGYSTVDRLPVGLLVVNDTTDKESPPALTQESMSALSEHLSYRLEAQYPFQVLKLEESPEILSGQAGLLQHLGTEAGVEYLVVAIVSSLEVEVSERLPLQGMYQGGGGRGWLVGYRAENYSLAEIAFVDVRNKQSLFEASGQGYATLDRLAVPLESNVYPVIYQAQRQAPIYPEESYAHDVLRVVSAQQAIEQALLHLNRWPSQRPVS